MPMIVSWARPMALGLTPASVAGTAGPGTAFTGRSVICSPKKSRAYTGSIFAPAKKGDCSFGPRGSRLTGANRLLRAIRDRCGSPPAHAGTPHPPQALAYVGHSVAERAPKSNTNHRMGCTDLLDLLRLLSVHSLPDWRAKPSGATPRPPGGAGGGRHEPAVAATWADGRQRDHLVSRKT